MYLLLLVLVPSKTPILWRYYFSSIYVHVTMLHVLRFCTSPSTNHHIALRPPSDDQILVPNIPTIKAIAYPATTKHSFHNTSTTKAVFAPKFTITKTHTSHLTPPHNSFLLQTNNPISTSHHTTSHHNHTTTTYHSPTPKTPSRKQMFPHLLHIPMPADSNQQKQTGPSNTYIHLHPSRIQLAHGFLRKEH